ncbi:hypothetical protein [Nonomuraea sp. SYSU D8015]|uniref:hypothetical protein n=1 Tax=Nonomuraea sp. SYSU D8015 TaxID=2593644 RepID=UPI001661345F|nr:hypothetical protein [Nonomuraea sp. SYSU D8015]
MSHVDDTEDETTSRTYYLIRIGIMVSTICAAGLSLGDQSQLAVKVMGWTGWGGLQPYLLPGSVIALEAVCLIIYNVVRDHRRKTLIFRWSILATFVSASLNIIWSRIHNGYDSPAEWLVWYIAMVPNAMLLASLKVGTYLTPPRKKKPLPVPPNSGPEDEKQPVPKPPEDKKPEEKPEELPAPPPEKPVLPKPPVLVPLPAFGKEEELPRKTVLICLQEITERKSANPEDDLAELSGGFLERTYGRIGRRGWTNAKKEALQLWEKDPDKWRQLLKTRVSA